jgi:hypothetical protein
MTTGCGIDLAAFVASSDKNQLAAQAGRGALAFDWWISEAVSH